MSQVLYVNSTDQHIAYSGSWNLSSKTTVFSYSTNSACFLLFRGTSVKMYGNTREVIGGALRFVLDGIVKTIQLNDTTFHDGVTPMYQADNMEDEDHQFSCDLIQSTSGSAEVDHFEIETSSGGGFNLLSVGPTAQNVPAKAVIVDNTSPDIIYHNPSDWNHVYDRITVYGRTISTTNVPGGSLSYSFDGVAIWFYGSIGATYGGFTVSINGSTAERLTASDTSYMDQRMLWSNTNLGNGRHTVTLTQDDNATASLSLDFFRILPGEGSSMLLSSTLLSSTLLSPTRLSTFSTTSLRESPTDVSVDSTTNQIQPNRIPLAVGLALGLLALVVGVLGSVRYLYRRKERNPVHLDAPPAIPYTVPPVRQADHQSSLPQNGKGPPEPARPSDTATSTGDLALSSSGDELEPPPSYESPLHGWREVVAK